MPHDRVQKVIKALNSRVRREILWRVWDRERAVAEIADGLGVTAPTLSGHLAILRDADLLTMRPDGTTRWYRAKQDAVAGFRGLLDDPARWGAGEVHPQSHLTVAGSRQAIVARASAPCTPADAFRAFNDGRIYGMCIDGEVSIENGLFTASTRIGVVVRGAYVLTCPPSLIVMAWDFSINDTPVPGGAQRAHLIISPETGPAGDAGHCLLDVTQFVASPDQTEFMDRAWRYVLGGFAQNIEAALERFPDEGAQSRA